MQEIQEYEKLRIEEYGLDNFMRKAEKALKEGYDVNYDEVADYPQSYGGFFSMTVRKKVSTKEAPQKVEVEPEEPKTEPEVKAEPARRGRKASQ